VARAATATTTITTTTILSIIITIIKIMKRKCCHNPRSSGLKYCKNHAKVSLFLRGFNYEDFEDKCDRARYCIECAVELIGDKPENLMGFFISKRNPRIQQIHPSGWSS